MLATQEKGGPATNIGVDIGVPLHRRRTEEPLMTNAEPRTAPGLRNDKLGKKKGRDSLNFSNEVTAPKWSGRLDLNQRPLAPQASPLIVQAIAAICNYR